MCDCGGFGLLFVASGLMNKEWLSTHDMGVEGWRWVIVMGGIFGQTEDVGTYVDITWYSIVQISADFNECIV